MTQKELEAVLNGYVELEVDGNLYECIGHEETGDSSVRNVLLSDVNDGYAINRTIQELLEMPSDNIYIRTGAGRLEQIYQSDARNREVLEDSEYAVALLKVRPDIAEYDDIAHMEYDWACWRLGADRKPNAEMYTVAFAEPIAPDSIVKQSGTDDKSKAFALIANEFLQKMNDKNERPQEIDGYFGLLPDTSDVVLVKIEDTVKAYYNEGKLTEINYHQFADDSDKSVKKAPIEPER